MAKRNKRRKAKKRQQVHLSQSRIATVGTAAKKNEPKVSFTEEYLYVFSDLRRMGILAAGMFILMIVLVFVLQ